MPQANSSKRTEGSTLRSGRGYKRARDDVEMASESEASFPPTPRKSHRVKAEYDNGNETPVPTKTEPSGPGIAIPSPYTFQAPQNQAQGVIHKARPFMRHRDPWRRLGPHGTLYSVISEEWIWDDKNSPFDTVDLTLVESAERYGSPYATYLRTFMERTYIFFPQRMLLRLETGYRRRRHMALTMPAADIHPDNPNPAAYAVKRTWDVFWNPAADERPQRCEELLGVAMTPEKANTMAMMYYIRFYEGNMCIWSGFEGHNVQRMDCPPNGKGSLFMEVGCEYEDHTSLGVGYELHGGRDCSMWGIDDVGCLGLLAADGLRTVGEIYVEPIRLFD